MRSLGRLGTGSNVTIRFAKYQGLGNDFVVVKGPLMDAARAVRICDRRRGIGADGVLTLLPPRTPGAVAAMHIYNSDGSVAAMCGNGIRCVVRALLGTPPPENPFSPEEHLVIDTDSGPKQCTAHPGESGEIEEVTVEMGPAKLLGEEAFEVGDERLTAVRVSMGNPHAVLFDVPTRERALAVGPAIEKGVAGGVNVGFARPSKGPEGGIDLVVWERGAGLTEACGTGACAAAVAAVSRSLAASDFPIEVRLPGGALRITVSSDLVSVRMKGPAEFVFGGEAEL
jgi:diaminopimelate epimerase